MTREYTDKDRLKFLNYMLHFEEQAAPGDNEPLFDSKRPLDEIEANMVAAYLESGMEVRGKLREYLARLLRGKVRGVTWKKRKKSRGRPKVDMMSDYRLTRWLLAEKFYREATDKNPECQETAKKESSWSYALARLKTEGYAGGFEFDIESLRNEVYRCRHYFEARKMVWRLEVGEDGRYRPMCDGLSLQAAVTEWKRFAEENQGFIYETCHLLPEKLVDRDQNKTLRDLCR